MSIIDSATDRQEAELRLDSEDEAKLEAELAYWSLATLDHHHEWAEAQERVAAIADLTREAQGWVNLVTIELRKRRDEKRAKAGG